MKQFLCYCPDGGESIVDSLPIEAESPEEAAEKYHEKINQGCGFGDWQESVEVFVHCESEKKVVKYRCSVTTVVRYSAREIQ